MLNKIILYYSGEVNRLFNRHGSSQRRDSTLYRTFSMSNLVDMIIGKRLTPEEQVKKWRSTIRTQERELDKTLRQIDTEQTKAKKLIKQAR